MRFASRGVALAALLTLAPGCAGPTMRAVGGLMAVGGATSGLIGAGISLDRCIGPKGSPCRERRPGDPKDGVPIAMAGAVVALVGVILLVQRPRVAPEPPSRGPSAPPGPPDDDRSLAARPPPRTNPTASLLAPPPPDDDARDL